MFYIVKNEELVLFEDDKTKFDTTLILMPQLANEHILQTDIITAEELHKNPNKVIIGDVEIEVDVPDYETQTVEQETPIFDKDGVVTGYETKTVEIQVEVGSHKEIITVKGLVLNPNYESEQEAKEKERIGNLTCTKRVFALMLQEMGISYASLKELIATNEQAQLEWDLCVELNRNNPLLDIMAGTLGITPIQLDGLFKYANGEITLEDFKALVEV